MIAKQELCTGYPLVYESPAMIGPLCNRHVFRHLEASIISSNPLNTQFNSELVLKILINIQIVYSSGTEVIFPEDQI